MRPIFIVLDGPDGVGKSTLQEALADKITALVGPDQVVCSRQPFRYKDEITRTSFTNWVKMVYLFMKDREEHWKEILQPALEAGKIILQDRYVLSTQVYQGLFGRFSFQDLWDGHAGFSKKPDLTLWVDAPTKILAQRMAARGIELMEVEQGEYLPLARLHFEKVVTQAQWPYRKIDASGTVQEAIDQAWTHVAPFIEERLDVHPT